jgi:diguanylate cyclase (GGDEF)-like protein
MNEPSPKPSTDFNPLDAYGDTQRITHIFNIFTTVIFFSLGAGIFILLSNRNIFEAISLTVALPLVLFAFFFIKRKQFEITAVFLAIILFLLLTFISTSGLGVHSLSNFGYPAILIVASLVMRKRTLVFLTIIAITCVAWLVFGELAGSFKPDTLVKSVPGDFFTLAVMLIATSFMSRVLSESLFQSNREVKKELVERKRAEERLAYDALHDALTGLPNRTLLFDRLGQKIEHARRHPEDLFAVLFIDLDRFKVVNDSLGHTVGDQMLVATAQRLTQCLRSEDTVSRLSGDEFAILLSDIRDISDAIRVAERVQTKLTSTSMIENLNRVTTASIGIAVYKDSYTHPQELLRDSDSAMYRAKAMGGGHYVIFDDAMYANAMALMQMEADLKRAVENNEWQVYYQPIVRLPDKEIIGMEALLRWNHPQRGIIFPAEFIHIAEDTGLILPIGKYVLQEACAQVKAWRKGKYPTLWVSVNLSGRQFQDQNLLSIVQQNLIGFKPTEEILHLEITESVAMKDLSQSTRILNELDQLGVKVSLDDFGIGYSSLGYLNRFPIRILKIDRSFINDINENRNSEAIISAIISMGHALKLEVVAEGVETDEQLAFLQSISCDEIQGYLISPPLPADQLEGVLEV